MDSVTSIKTFSPAATITIKTILGRPQNPSPLDIHYQTIRANMRGVFHELWIAV
jgi:hypothetical protein